MALTTQVFDHPSGVDPTQKVFGSKIITLETGNHIFLDARGHANFTVIAATGATVTVSRVDLEGDAHTTGAENQFTVAANTRTVTPVDWPWYRISTAGATCRIAAL